MTAYYFPFSSDPLLLRISSTFSLLFLFFHNFSLHLCSYPHTYTGSSSSFFHYLLTYFFPSSYFILTHLWTSPIDSFFLSTVPLLWSPHDFFHYIYLQGITPLSRRHPGLLSNQHHLYLRETGPKTTPTGCILKQIFLIIVTMFSWEREY